MSTDRSRSDPIGVSDTRAKCANAIDLALRGEWDRAHQVVQDLDGEMPAWIHAVLHKIEGDLGNSQYWYRRANRPFTEEDPKQELARIQAGNVTVGPHP